MTLCNERVLRNMPRYGYEVTRLTMDDINEMLEFRLSWSTELCPVSSKALRNLKLPR